MNERRAGDSELRIYLDGKFGDILEAINAHKLENVRDITVLQGQVAAQGKDFRDYKERTEKLEDAATSDRRVFWYTVGAGVVVEGVLHIAHFFGYPGGSHK